MRKKYSETIAAVEEIEADEHVENETPNDRFKRLANFRVMKAVQRIRMIRNLAGPNYTYTEEQAHAILDALRAEVDALSDLFFADEDEIKPLF